MPVPNNLRIRKKRKKVNATFITNMRKRGERMKVKTIPEINMTDNPLDNIIKMAPYLDGRKSANCVRDDVGSGYEYKR